MVFLVLLLCGFFKKKECLVPVVAAVVVVLLVRRLDTCAAIVHCVGQQLGHVEAAAPVRSCSAIARSASPWLAAHRGLRAVLDERCVHLFERRQAGPLDRLQQTSTCTTTTTTTGCRGRRRRRRRWRGTTTWWRWRRRRRRRRSTTGSSTTRLGRRWRSGSLATRNRGLGVAVDLFHDESGRVLVLELVLRDAGVIEDLEPVGGHVVLLPTEA